MSITNLSLFKRSNGRYYILYVEDGRTRWKSTGATRKNDALRALTEFKRLLAEKPTSKLLSQFIPELLTFIKGNYSRGTHTIYESTLRKFRETLHNDLSLTSVSPKHADFYKTERLKCLSPVTVNIELRTLRAAFNIAKRWGLIEQNPFSLMKLADVPETEPSFFTKEDFQRLISSIKEEWLQELIVFAVLTGMRRAEIVNLRWEDVDFNRRALNVQSNATFRTKQGKRRMIPLSDIAYHLLQARHGKSAGEYVFTLNDRKINEGWVSHKFKYYVYEAKLPNDRLHFHSLRHTFASWLVQDGVSLYEVQKLLGHSNISVTQVYSHLQPEGLHSTVNRISIPMN